jgi:ADP-heptose:LPS heptosyltransferase
MNKEVLNCKNFTGYKPCFPDHDCWKDGCKEHLPVGTKILIINLDAMGDVLMTTAQLPALKRKFPESTIWWITLPPADKLLINNIYLDKVLQFNAESFLILSEMKFDLIMNIDKSQRSCALLNSVKADKKLGFGLTENGKIIPLNKGAEYNFVLGMNDHLKFKVNKRTGQDYLAETLELTPFYKNDEYVFSLNDEEISFTNSFKNQNGISENDFVIGFNTGCSNLYPNKKMNIEQHVYLIKNLLLKDYKILLLGGPEDTERNNEIYSHFPGKIINTPTTEGIRRGACYESIPDLIITGDSFGMHLAIALKKYVIAWFGLSCWTEIELYNRGIKLFNENLDCSPCWKKNCPYNLECIETIDLNKIIEEVDSFFMKKRIPHEI